MEFDSVTSHVAAVYNANPKVNSVVHWHYISLDLMLQEKLRRLCELCFELFCAQPNTTSTCVRLSPHPPATKCRILAFRIMTDISKCNTRGCAGASLHGERNTALLTVGPGTGALCGTCFVVQCYAGCVAAVFVWWLSALLPFSFSVLGRRFIPSYFNRP